MYAIALWIWALTWSTIVPVAIAIWAWGFLSERVVAPMAAASVRLTARTYHTVAGRARNAIAAAQAVPAKAK